MAKKHLLQIIDRLADDLKKDKDYWRKYYNRKVHVYNVEVENLIQQVYAQLSSLIKKPSEAQARGIRQAVEEYAAGLYDAFNSRKSKEYKFTVQGNPKKFYVVIEHLEGAGDSFNNLATIRRPFHKTLQNKIFFLLNRVKDQEKALKLVKGTYNEAKNNYEHGLFDIGHADGSSIAEKRIATAIARFSTLPKVSEAIGSRSSDLIIRSQESSRALKSFIIEVSDESSVRNRGKQEAAWINDTVKALRTFVNKNSDWASQRGSRSAVDIVVAELLATARKSGAKISGPPLQNRQPPQTAKGKLKGSTSIVSQTNDIIELPKEQRVDQNWSRLIPIINAKLTQTIISNMIAPGLVNRTGTFAQSARLVGVEVTAKGFPSFVFDYERKPYDVFDPAKGAQPWNTPERSPAALVSKSIREIVSELAIGRFYTRRV